MLLDSNILIRFANEMPHEIETVLRSGQCAIASVVEIEVYGFTGITEQEKTALNGVFKGLTIYQLDKAVILQAISLRQHRKMAVADAIIASTALVHGLPLVTQNVRDFRHIGGLEIIDPFE